MVRKALSRITNKISGLHEAAFWLASFGLASQALAFLRDRILAHHFGAGKALDLYFASFEVPDLIFSIVASLVGAAILVPLFSEKNHHHGGESQELKNFNNSIFTSFLILLVISCAVIWIFMPTLIPFFFKDLGSEGTEQVIKFSRILLLSPLFLGLSNFFGSIVQYEKRFLLYSLSPLLYNIGIIIGAGFGGGTFGISAVVAGVAFGAFLHMAVLGLWVFSSDISPKITFKIDWREVRKTFLLSAPRTISLSATSLVGSALVILASKLGSGSIAAFTFSLNLQSVPLSIIGASYSVAAFPTLAHHHVRKEFDSLLECISTGLRHIIFWSLPITALFVILRAHIVRVILGSGAFSWSDTKITAAALAAFVLSITFQSIQLFLTRTHYALGKTKLPLIINVASAVATILIAILAYLFVSPSGNFLTTIARYLDISGVNRLPMLVLPLSFSLGSLVSAILLWANLDREVRKPLSKQIFKTGLSSLLVSVAISFATFFSLRFFDNIFSLSNTIGVFLQGLCAGLVGIIIGVFFLEISKNREYSEIIKKL